MKPHRTSRPGVLLNRMHAGQSAGQGGGRNTATGSAPTPARLSIAGRGQTDFWGRLLRPRGRPG